MIRCNLVKGDKSATGGQALEGIALCTIKGKEMAFLGAEVYCPACKTTGEIVGVGPRHPNNLMGKQQALEDDICVCRCNPPPVMIASQREVFHSFTAAELAAMGFDATGKPLERLAKTRNDGQYQFHEQVQLSAPPGYDLAGMRYLIKGSDGSVQQGTVPEDGQLPRIFTSHEATYTVLWGDQAAAEDE
ncbi:PAAR domain-containing protein [Cupriavidus sp. BIS7]|uniref:PAAR domain-containing protein n=1 Tax=Cupriavidus sp. BIS7 TaxID=1217718 RepID=UPI00036378C5|nr:PAAR domain-containing protein [Cupriavidus sp. BIS7]